ncbi:histone-like nucleoid-structuring protein Lsr2 [Streptomyces sp. x-19]|uniref:histone-like nucleoid-structuring protein Lsr2 n=1 Tax=Streptomyces sp. x-19 TaxID=2789280 RepID=UPI00398174AB
MAQKVVTIYTDDLTGEESPEAATHSIAIDGVKYEIDLGPDSYDKMLEALAPFTRAGRRVRGSRKAGGRTDTAVSSGVDTAKIRAWAKENDYDVNDRGRVPAEIREAYTKAH